MTHGHHSHPIIDLLIELEGEPPSASALPAVQPAAAGELWAGAVVRFEPLSPAELAPIKGVTSYR